MKTKAVDEDIKGEIFKNSFLILGRANVERGLLKMRAVCAFRVVIGACLMLFSSVNLSYGKILF